MKDESMIIRAMKSPDAVFNTCLISEATSLPADGLGAAFFGAKSESEPSAPIVAKFLAEQFAAETTLIIGTPFG